MARQSISSCFIFLFFAFIACQPSTPAGSGAVDSVAMNAAGEHGQVKDSIYKVGDYLFEGEKDLVFDYFPNTHPPLQLKSNGDTLYRDSSFTILADIKKVRGDVYKRYQRKYDFKDFAVKKQYRGPFARPNFHTDPPANGYRTMIKMACAKDTIDFAGHYTIAEWGCGTECAMMAVVDRVSGRIFYSNEYIPFDTSDGHSGIQYRRDSRLVVVNSLLLEDYPGYCMQHGRGVYYYEWTGTGFAELK